MRFVTTIAVVLWFACLAHSTQAQSEPHARVLFADSEEPSGSTGGRYLVPLTVVVAIVSAGLIWVAWWSALRRRLKSETEKIRGRLEREANLEARYRDLFESASDAVFTLDGEGLVTAMNPAGFAITGLKEGDSFLDAVTPPALASARELLNCHTATTREIALTSDSGVALLEISVRPTAGFGVQAIARDLTLRKRLEAELRQSQKMEVIGRLSGGVAHDFNNLLTVINGNAAVLRTHLTNEDRILVDEIIQAGENASALTRQLLTFSRKSVVSPKILSPNDAIASIRTMLLRLLGEHIQFETDLDANAGHIKIDPGQLEQVLVSLAVNSRDAMAGGGKLTIRTQRIDKSIRIQVADTGDGMDRTTKARIFEPFFSTKPAGEGTGLGLATVRFIVEQLGGSIDVQSEPKRGATFTIDLPRCDEGSSSPTGASSTPVEEIGKKVILLVEDEPAVQLLERRILEMGKFEVLVASGGEEALRLLDARAGVIDLLVTDVVMPGMSGRELAEQVELRRPGVPALFLSGYTPDDILRQGIHSEIKHFLQKPFTPSALLSKVREVLALSPAPTPCA